MKKLISTLAMVAACIPATAMAQDDYGDDVDYIAPAKDKAGFRVEGRVFYERIDDPIENTNIVYEFGNGFGAGVEFGADFAVKDNLVVGPYVTYDFSSLETCEDNLCFATPEYWAVGVHVGFTAGDKGLVYGKLGYGEQTVTLEGTFEDPETVIVTLDEQTTGSGYNFAFGYEHGLGETLYVRGEFGVSQSNDIYGFDLQRGLFGLAIGARF